jgi:hypothetical protein
VLDSVEEERSGVFFGEPTVQSLHEALQNVGTRTTVSAWDRGAIRAHAAQFSRARFLEQFRDALARTAAP